MQYANFITETLNSICLRFVSETIKKLRILETMRRASTMRSGVKMSRYTYAELKNAGLKGFAKRTHIQHPI